MKTLKTSFTFNNKRHELVLFLFNNAREMNSFCNQRFFGNWHKSGANAFFAPPNEFGFYLPLIDAGYIAHEVFHFVQHVIDGKAYFEERAALLTERAARSIIKRLRREGVAV